MTEHELTAITSARFWRKVDRSAGLGGCWLWTGTRSRGYGYASVRGGSTTAHRVAWELTNGPIPAGLHCCHSCDNPPCVNPAHLWLGTRSDNIQDAKAKGRMRWPGRPGEQSANARLREDEVREIFELRRAGARSRDIAEAYGVSANHVNDIVRGVRWRHLGLREAAV